MNARSRAAIRVGCENDSGALRAVSEAIEQRQTAGAELGQGQLWT